MPWTAADAHAKTHKATTAKGKRQWADVANSALTRGLPEGEAIREANAVAAKRKKSKAHTLYDRSKHDGG
jgi:hypothetical protein